MTGREEITFVQMIIAKEFNAHKKKIRDVLNRVCVNSCIQFVSSYGIFIFRILMTLPKDSNFIMTFSVDGYQQN